MNLRGVTLIEVLVAVTIVAVLAVALGFSYQGWMGGYQRERVTKDLYADLMQLRSHALSRNRMYFMRFADATHYAAFEDTNDSLSLDAADLPVVQQTKLTDFELRWDGAVPANNRICFGKRGITNIGDDVANPDGSCAAAFPGANPVVSLLTDPAIDPDYDCIVISQTKIDIGKMTAGACNAK